MAEQPTDTRSEMAVFQAQRAKVEAFVVLQQLPRSFDDMLDRLTKTAAGLRKGTVTKEEAVKALAEIILGVELDKRNFRRKILEARIIEETGEYRTGEGRPAMQYRFRADAVAETKARRLFP